MPNRDAQSPLSDLKGDAYYTESSSFAATSASGQCAARTRDLLLVRHMSWCSLGQIISVYGRLRLYVIAWVLPSGEHAWEHGLIR